MALREKYMDFEILQKILKSANLQKRGNQLLYFFQSSHSALPEFLVSSISLSRDMICEQNYPHKIYKGPKNPGPNRVKWISIYAQNLA